MAPHHRIRALAAVLLLGLGIGCEQILGLDASFNTSILTGDTTCTENAEESCYSADPATLGVGVCKAGKRTCENGVWGACFGEVVPTYETCSGQDVDCNGEVTCASEFAWGKSFGGSADDSVGKIVVDLKDNLFVLGNFSSPEIDLGGGPMTNVGAQDFYLAKLDPSGKHLWSYSFGGMGNDSGRFLAVDPAGNVQITAHFEQTMAFGDTMYEVPQGRQGLLLAKFGPNGESLGSTAFFAQGFGTRRVVFDAAGDLIFVVTFTGQVDFGGGIYGSQNDTPVAIVKYSGTTGAHQWTRVFNGAQINSAMVDIDPSGNIGLAGTYSGKLNFGGSVLESVGNDIYVAKLSPSGQHLWSTKIGGMKDETLEDFVINKAGNWIVLGSWYNQMADGTTTSVGAETFTAHGQSDMFLAQYDNDGAFVWAKDLGSVGSEYNGGLTVDSTDDIIVSGTSNSADTDLGFGKLGTAGLFVLKYDSSGLRLWMRNSSAAANNGVNGGQLATDSYRAIIIGGGFQTPLSFDGFSFPSAGGWDGYVMKIAP